MNRMRLIHVITLVLILMAIPIALSMAGCVQPRDADGNPTGPAVVDTDRAVIAATAFLVVAEGIDSLSSLDADSPDAVAAVQVLSDDIAALLEALPLTDSLSVTLTDLLVQLESVVTGLQSVRAVIERDTEMLRSIRDAMIARADEGS